MRSWPYQVFCPELHALGLPARHMSLLQEFIAQPFPCQQLHVCPKGNPSHFFRNCTQEPFVNMPYSVCSQSNRHVKWTNSRKYREVWFPSFSNSGSKTAPALDRPIQQPIRGHGSFTLFDSMSWKLCLFLTGLSEILAVYTLTHTLISMLPRKWTINPG